MEFACDVCDAVVDAWGATPERKVILNPVSYTHLRAHETVLDLVCRLLLETKQSPST